MRALEGDQFLRVAMTILDWGRDLVTRVQTHDGVRGIEAYRATWPPFLGWLRVGTRFEIIELSVIAGDDVAYAWALLRCGTEQDLTDHPERRLRLSLGLRRENGRWIVAHEHHSFADDS